MFYVLNFRDHTFESEDSVTKTKNTVQKLLKKGALSEEIEIVNGFFEGMRYNIFSFNNEFREGKDKKNKLHLTEAVETCPYCNEENVYPNWDTKEMGYIAKCRHCGKDIFLCDKCLHAEDNPSGKCDWNKHNECTRFCQKGTIEAQKTLVKENITLAMENNHLFNDDTFIVLNSSGCVRGVYYNPDASCGGQLVYTEISATDLVDELNELDCISRSGIESCITVSDSRELDKLVDVNTENFKEALAHIEDINTGDVCFWSDQLSAAEMLTTIVIWYRKLQEALGGVVQ